jgi:hypothetical protein
MKKAGIFFFSAACLTTMFALPAAAGAPTNKDNSVEVEKPAAAAADTDQSYRPRWADPNAKPPEPGIENDPTTFNPADVDVNTDQLNNNISPINPD